MLDDRRVEVCEIADSVGISKKKGCDISFMNKLGMQKLCARWVPHFLNEDQEQM